MNTDLTQRQKQHAHCMIERLAPEKLSVIVELLEVLLDPLDRALATAEIDDEPVTEEEKRDVEASREWFKHNEGIPFEQVVAELGFTMEEVTNYKDPSSATGASASPAPMRILSASTASRTARTLTAD